MEKKIEIDLRRLFAVVLQKLWIIIIAAVAMAIAAYTVAATCMTPLYTATVSLYVNSHADRENRNVQAVNSNEIVTAQYIVVTYLKLLSSDTVLEKVAEELDNRYTASQLRGMIDSSEYDETEIFEVTVTNPDPDEAAKIANAMADVAPTIISAEYIEGSSVKVVDYAKTPRAPSSPSKKKCALIGFLLGGGLSAIIIVLLSLFNSKISTENDIKQLFDIPVIGEMPSFVYHAEKEKEHKGRQRRGAARKERRR